MKLLDLFCGLGGASVGYARAGFEVVGVDLIGQPDYPFEFVRGDALAVLADTGFVRSFDAIHASPPCQAYTALQAGTNAAAGREHPRLTELVRAALVASGRPYALENPAARPDVVLCGEMFGLDVLRHRKFELGGWTTPRPAHPRHRGRVRGWRHGVHFDGPYVAVHGDGGGKATLDEARRAMDIPWATDRRQLVEAIPPAYAGWIGARLLAYLTVERAA